MSRNRPRLAALNLTPLMDVFTTLVFFLVVNQSTTEILETPKRITLPDSVVEEKPRETVVIFVSPEEVTVQGEPVARVADILASSDEDVAGVGDRLTALGENVIGLRTKIVAESQEVTILADKSVPFVVVKRVMSTCTGRGYGHISLAVLQKTAQATQI
jgi:biopolymer transport protein ExbD